MPRPGRILSAQSATLAWLGAWISLLAGCTWAYWPGLAGPFLLDDFKSLAELGSFGGVTDWASFKAFVLGGHAGPTGRPLALLSFLVDGNNWPTDPWPFKRTNLVIHLLSGVMLGLLSQRILATLQYDRSTARSCALVAAAIWLLHPFLVSTTLYAVQRMAQLSTLFVFVGLAVYLHGRAIVATDRRKAYALMSIAVVVATGLATLSKENGILLPMLVGIAELTIVASQRSRLGILNRTWAIALILLPTLAVFAFLAWRVTETGFFDVAPGRDFSIHERLLTQFRVVADYLQHWFVPELYTTGVFQDHVVKSTGLLSPLTTLLGLLLHAALVIAAFLLRRRKPLFAFAILFFYGSHVLESTVLNLELYFEHRNYLAAAFLFLPLIVAVQRALPRWSFAALSLVLASLMAILTHYTAAIWADYDSIVRASAEKAPTSVRAQQQLAMMLFNDGEYQSAVQVIDRALEERPDSDTLLVNRGIILCRIGALGKQDFAVITQKISSQPYNGRLFAAYSDFARTLIDSGCVDEPAQKVRAMFVEMLAVPGNADPASLAYSHIHFFIGYSWMRSDDMSRAVEAFERSLDARGGAGPAMMMAAMLAASGDYDEALRFSDRALDKLDAGEAGLASERRVRRSDVLEFQSKVQAELAGKGANEKD